jgi:serine/threonine protein kinase
MDDIQFSQKPIYLIGKYLSNYRLIKQLGQGGFATVYLGRHRYLGTLAAIKVLDTELTPYELGRFLREARLTAQLRHRHIIRVLDFGKEDDIPFLVTEYAPYHTLRNLHPHGCRLTPGTVVSYTRQVASALQYMHERGIIHHDVKPENMLIGEEHQVLLSDFGISIVAHKTHAIDKREIIGSLPYMAPEQLRGEPCVASDQYALGVVVYEWLTGSLPFEGSRRDVMQGHLYEPPPSLRGIVPTLPLAIERVVLKALAKAPEERFGSVREFAEALERAYRQPITQTRTSRLKRPKRKKHLQAAGLLAACCVIGIALGILPYGFGSTLEWFWLLLMVLLTGAPLVISLHMHNDVAFPLLCGVFTVSAFLGFAFQSAPTFFVLYSMLSFFTMLVVFNHGIQDEHPRKRP